MNEQDQSSGKGRQSQDDLVRAGEALRLLILAAEHYRQAVAVETGLDVRQTQAISYLHSRGPMGQSELAEALGLNTGSVTSLVDRLEAHAIARRTPHPTDRRRFVVELSDAGNDIIRRSNAFLVGAFGEVDPSRFGELADTLGLLAGGLRRQIETMTPDQ